MTSKRRITKAGHLMLMAKGIGLSRDSCSRAVSCQVTLMSSPAEIVPAYQVDWPERADLMSTGDAIEWAVVVDDQILLSGKLENAPCRKGTVVRVQFGPSLHTGYEHLGRR